jgi:hypothetical protein
VHNGGVYGDGTAQSGVGVERRTTGATRESSQLALPAGRVGDAGADHFAECGGKTNFGEKKSDRFVRGPQCLPWPKPERKENKTTVHIADTTNEPGATAPSGLPKPLVEAPPEAAHISEVSTTENPS